MKLPFLLLLSFQFFFTCFGLAQEKLPVTATRILNPPKLDGHLDDDCWKEAKPYNQFFEGAPTPGIPTNNTEVFVVYNNDAIYVGIKCFMQRDSIWMHLSKRDNLFDDADAIFFGFDTYHDGLNGFGFGVSARGVQSDFKIYANSEIDNAWDAVWDSKVIINDDGYYAEIKIPYSALRFPKVDVQDWAVDFYRIVRRTRHDYHSCNNDPEVNGIVSQWQPLEGISNIEPPLRLSLSPYATYYFNTYHDKENDVTTNASQLKGGMDLKWGVSQSFTLDATLIPDFGQVQSDNIIYNLTAFEVQYDEKRPFFTEGTELFNKAELFYSRRVGFISDYYDEHGDSNVSILNYPVNTKLLNATKFSGRTKSGLGIGIFNGITGNTYAVGVNEEGDTADVLVDPLTNFNVLVLDKTLKNNSFFTFTNTNVIRDAEGRDANVANVLAFIANKKNSYAGYGYLAVSTLRNQFGDSIEFTNGYLNKLGFEKISGNFTFEVSHRAISPDYNQNDLGYLEFNNQNTEEAEFKYNINSPFGKFNELHSFNTINYDYRNNNGAFINTAAHGFFELVDKKYWGFFSYYYFAPFGFHNYYEPRVEGRYYDVPAAYELGLGFNTDYRKHFALSVEGGPTIWNETGRIKYRWQIEPRFRIGNSFTIIPSSETHLYMNDVGYVDVDSSSNIIFGRRDVTEVNNAINASYFFNGNLSIGAKLRYYTNKGAYDQYYVLNEDGTTMPTANYSGNANYNFNAWTIDMSLTWWFLPGSEIDLVWKNAITGFDDITNLSYRENFNHTFDFPSNNNLSLRVRYYIDYQMVKKLLK
ncbi:MAG: carbohydrate binding family 9 domain-containing protein [Chitinophagales bacterium]|nr:carbohydrate binding family 9 domain-containing protein [Chitinophagales bacterium]